MCVLDDNKKFVVGVNISTFPKEIGRLSAKGFLVLNRHNIITDIIEKQIKSEYISVGLYGFSDADLFQEAYLHLQGISNTYEIYLSHIISCLIGTKKAVYKYLEAEDYEDWGTLKDWNIILEEKRSLIINMDGLLFEKCKQYGRNKKNVPLIPREEN